MHPLPSDDANRRTRDIFQLAYFVFEHPGCTRNFIQENVDLSATAKSTLINYVNAAIDFGWLQRSGTNRDINYSVTDDFRNGMVMRLLRSKSRTGLVGYNHEFLSSYQPNTTFLLKPKQLEVLERKGLSGAKTINLKDPGIKLAVRRFMTDLSFHSSRLEGLRLRYADTLAFLEEGIQSDSMSPHDAMILRNHYNTIKAVIDGITQPCTPGDIDITEYDIRCIHSSISDGLLEERKMQGRLRANAVQINHSRYVPPDNITVIEGHFHEVISKARQIKNPFEQSFFVSVHIPYLQPFIDCNKRTARICANIPLIRHGCIPFSWADSSPEAYNEAMVAIYEFNELRPFAEIFCEAYSRSSDRFEVTMNRREPNRLEITYAKEIADAVRAHIMENKDVEPPTALDNEQARAFQALVVEILEDIRDNEMVAAPYRIPKRTLAEWRTSQSPNNSYGHTHEP